MSFELRELVVNLDTRTIVRSTTQYRTAPKASEIARVYYKTKVVFGVTFLNPDGSAVTTFAAADDFEMSIDSDFSHILARGTLDSAYSGAVTSIDVTFEEDPGDLAQTGNLSLRNDDFQRENVAYTDVTGTGTSRTFAVGDTLTYSYDAGDAVGVEDKLMVRVDNTDVDVPGDWSETDRATGKVSFQLDCTDYEFLRKMELGGLNELLVNIEIKRFPDGETSPTVLCQDTIYSRNIVRDTE